MTGRLPDTFPDPSRLTDPTWQATTEAGALARGWRWLGHAADLPDEAARPVRIDEEPLVLARSGGQARLFSNVCTHRWHAVLGASEDGAAVPCRTLRCGYHGRRFDLTGRCVGAPGFESVPGFPGADDHLPTVPFAEWRGHQFGALAPEVGLDDALEPVRARLDFLPWERAVRDPSAERVYEIDAHWTLYVENYLEGLHVPFVHRGLMGALDLGAYRTLPLPHGVLQIGSASEGADAFDLPEGHPDHGLRVAAWYVCLFPTTMLNVYPWGVSLNSVEPVPRVPGAPARTRVRYSAFVWNAARRPGPEGAAASADLDRVEREDDAVVESVARGARSRFARRTAYAPGWEDGVRAFHGWLG